LRRYNLLTWVLIIFFFTGFLTEFALNPSRILVPLLVFGSIIYFFKYPEKLKGLLQKGNRRNTYYNGRNKPNSRKDTKFKVIDGRFKDVNNDHDDNDDKPKYH